jgi:crotonobetainyl-CoA:carnitine CoA-transferase CaiB-like acyl-CoA transferase
MTADKSGPLAGLRVLDASRVLAGPFCGQVFGDLGAEVLKIERPGAGDEKRGWGQPFVSFAEGAAELSAYYLSCNRNKQGITLDLGRPEGVRIFQELARKSDVVLENFRASSAAKLGLSPAELLAINPRLIVCSISGYGRTGPWSDLPGYDFAVQALSGLMSVTGPADGEPSKVGVAVTDVLTGLYAAVAVLACVHARQRTGHGYVIDMALLDCAVASQVNLAQAYLSSGETSPRQGNAHLQIVPYQLFTTADSWLVLAVGNDGQWRRFCAAVGRPEWAEDVRFVDNPSRVRHREALTPLIEVLMRTKKTSEWQQVLAAAEVPCAPVWTYADVFGCPQATARGLRVEVRDPSGRPVDLVGTPFHIAGTTLPAPTAPPTLGQHTDEIMTRLLGMDGAQLAELRRQGVIGGEG